MVENSIKYPEFAARLRMLMERSQTKVDELVESVDVTDEMIRRYMRGTAMPRSNKLAKLAEYYKVDCGWLQWGGQPPASVEFIGVKEALAQYEVKTTRIPVVGRAQLGDNGYWTDMEYPVGHGSGYIIWTSKDPNAYAVECIGESMKPRIQPNEFSVIEPNIEYTNGDEVLVRDKRGRVMIKRYLYSRDGKVHLFSVNDAYKPIEIEVELIDKIHKVGGIAPRSLYIESIEG